EIGVPATDRDEALLGHAEGAVALRDVRREIDLETVDRRTVRESDLEHALRRKVRSAGDREGSRARFTAPDRADRFDRDPARVEVAARVDVPARHVVHL